MSYSKLRNARSSSIIDISSSIQSSKRVPSHHSHIRRPSPTPKSNFNYNQNRARSQQRTFSPASHRSLCHSHSDDSLDQDFIQNTKHTVEKLFHRTNFNQILDQIQGTLQPITAQLRERIERKKHLSKKDRLLCLKSCARFIIETVLDHQWYCDDKLTELNELQRVLARSFSHRRIDASVQTSEQLETAMRQLQINKSVEKTIHPQSVPAEKLKKPPRISFASAEERTTRQPQAMDHLSRQKLSHRSMSSVFKKLNTELQRLHHETPFQSHLSNYHRHNHE
jgi:hypothetical protein